MRSGLADSDQIKHCAIYDAHASVVISGWDRSKYTGYAFLDPGSIEHHFEGDDVDDEAEEDGDNSDDSETAEIEPIEDHFATDGRSQFQDADSPVWDPRVAFLRAVHTRVQLALQEYSYLFGHVEVYMQTWVRLIQLPSYQWLTIMQMKENMGLTSGLPASWKQFESPLSDKELFACITHMKQLVRQLRAHLSKTTWVWTQFEGVHGDIAYFSDLSDLMATVAIDGIRDAFTDLMSFEEQLVFMEESCKEAAKTVSSFCSLLFARLTIT